MWRQVTVQLAALSQELGFLDVVLHPDLSLEDTMHAHQINDPKVDTKHDVHLVPSPAQMLEQGKLAHPKALTLRQTHTIFAKLTQLQGLVLKGEPLPQTIYTFSYLYDQKICEESVTMSALIESINTLGTHIYEIHKDACTVKEDDLSFNTFSFKLTPKSHDQAVDLLIKAEKQIDKLAKSDKDPQAAVIGKQTVALIRMRRAVHGLAKALAKTYNPKNQGKLENQLKALKKRIVEVESLIEKEKVEEDIPLGVFSESLFKKIRNNFGNREIKSLSLQDGIKEIRRTINQLELFFPAPPTVTECKNRLDILSHEPISLWAKAYIKFNLYQKEGFLLGAVSNEDALRNDIKDWAKLSQQVISDEKFENLLGLSSPAIAETLYLLSGRNSRWFWECSKGYEDMNVMIHLANDIDTRFGERKKGTYVASWFYNWATTSMARQILWGFEEDLYETAEYPVAGYYLEYILHIHQKNSQNFLNKLEPAILASCLDGALNKKQKKHMSDLEKKFLSEILFLRGLHYYIRAFHRLCIILVHRQLLRDPFKDSQQMRINNRFRIFKTILFVRKLSHKSYEEEKQTVLSDEGKILQEVGQILKGAKSTFALLSQFDSSETFCRQVQDAAVLEKLSVQLSLVVMALRFKQKKEFVLSKKQHRYPLIEMK